MTITFREFHSESDIKQCIDLQKSIFNLSDTDVISPLVLKLIMRNNPPLGIALGAFDDDNTLVGFFIGNAIFYEKSIYAMVMGVNDAFRKKGLGLGIFTEFKKISLEKGLMKMIGIYDPLDSKLAYLFFNKLGFRGIQLVKDAFNLNIANPDGDTNFTDRVLFHWDFQSRPKICNTELLHNYPVAESGSLPLTGLVLYNIPLNISEIDTVSPAKARDIRSDFRNIFDFYLNQHRYRIIGCIRQNNETSSQFYYVLEK